MKQFFSLAVISTLVIFGLVACGGGEGSPPLQGTGTGTEAPTFTLAYNGNGNTTGIPPVDINSYEEGQVVTLLGNTGAAGRTNFSFIGWNTLPDGTGTLYAQGQNFTMGAANSTLYAHWSANPTFTLTYEGNGHSAGSVPIDTTNYEHGQTVTVAGNSSGLTRSGFSFTGWNSLPDGTGTGYSVSQTFIMGSVDLTLYAQWTANPTFSVTYNGNGHNGGSVPVDSTSYEQNQVVTVLGNTGNLSNTGFSFTGWNSQSDGTGTGYNQGQTLGMGGSNLTLFAQWTANPTFTVTYNGNANSGGTVPVDASNYEQGQTVTVAGNTGNLSKTGFTFSGWNSQPGGTGTGYSVSQTFTMGAADLTLYAQWTANPTFQVTYAGNGSSGGSVPTDTNNYEQNQTVTVLGNTGNLTQAGFSFSGWNSLADGTGTDYSQGQTFTMGTADVVLYAQWTLNPTYTVTYAGNGNTGGNIPVDTTNYEQGQTVTVAGNTGSLTRTGFSFSGWNTQPDGSGTVYGVLQTFPMGVADLTLYAKWTANPTFTVTYLGNGSTGGSAPVDTGNYEQSQVATVLGNTGNLTRTGFSFSGWNTHSNGSGTAYSPSQAITIGTANVTLYAQWTILVTHRVTYSGNGSTSGSVPVDNKNYTQGQVVTVSGNAGNLRRTGFSFGGWKPGADGVGSGYSQDVVFAMGVADVTLHAYWIPSTSGFRDISYTTSQATGGGSTPEVSTVYHDEGAVAIALENKGNLLRTGFSFIGWTVFSDNLASNRSYKPGDPVEMNFVGTILQSDWTANPTHRITYNGNGSESGTVPIDTVNYESGDAVRVRGNTGNLSRTGFKFKGWNSLPNGTGTAYSHHQIFTMGNVNLTLYAQWTVNTTYRITYVGNGNTNGAVPVDTTNYEVNQSFTAAGNRGGLTKPGFKLIGWDFNVGNQFFFLLPGESTTMGGVVPAADLTMTALWQARSLTPHRIFNAGIHNGNLGGASGADATCRAASQSICANRPDVGAFLAYRAGNDAISEITPWAIGLDPFTPIVGPNGTQISATWAGLFDGIDNSLAAAGVLPANQLWWSGTAVFAGGSSVIGSFGCTNPDVAFSRFWTTTSTASGVVADAGSSSAVDTSWIYSSANRSTCNQSRYLLCVCGE